ncbi:MAG: hypothetical protein OXC56_00165 [Chloroflexi bacterium]|nr:hypothetical protein [Chloroflexota bacterium]
MIRLIVAAAVIAAFLAVNSAVAPTVTAQAPSVCLNLPAGEHEFRAASRERAGEIVFRVEVGEGGSVTEFYEPGGQPIGVAGFAQVFTGPEAYDLPEGVEIVDCAPAAEDDSDASDAALTYCTSLDAGTYTETVSAGGRSYEATINIGEGGRLIDVSVLGQTYGPREAIELLQGFGAALPENLNIAPCEAAPAKKSATGNAGLLESGGTSAFGYVAVAIAALAVGAGSVAVRRRIGS